MLKKRFAVSVSVLALGIGLVPLQLRAQRSLTRMEQVGKAIFNDHSLSNPEGQACSSCHGKQVGFTGPNSRINRETAVYPGAVASRFGNRKPPAAAYAGDVPVLDYNPALSEWTGGLFWDGRATGWTLGDPLAEQALGPFLNPLEQNNPDAASVCQAVETAPYSALFETVWGPGAIDCVGDVQGTYERIGFSISAYEHSAEVNPYSSRYDAYLLGEVSLNAAETQGLQLFEGVAGCASCHSVTAAPSGGAPLFTDFSYANLGLPKNENNPFYTMPEEWNPDGAKWVDPGLGNTLRNLGYGVDVYETEWGKHRVPTLRNVDRRPGRGAFVKAFGHNGYFKSLAQLVHFYNTRDVPGAGWMGVPWPAAEIPQNVSNEIGDLGLTLQEEAALVAFLQTLSDGYTP
ncbi:MAG: cytochrome C [Deltaproteobacteria bacterium]|nr:cytochrome C [Deltaproteobacteria bacterium]